MRFHSNIICHVHGFIPDLGNGIDKIFSNGLTEPLVPTLYDRKLSNNTKIAEQNDRRVRRAAMQKRKEPLKMDRNTAAGLLEQNLPAIFSYCLSRLYDKSEAEDLAEDILYEVLKSVHRLRNDEAFYGFLWKTAENVFRTYLRRKKYESVPFDEQFVGICYETPEAKLFESEEVHLLRRELSLLSKQYREITVLYYIYGKTCAEIASALQISKEMVKYYLFQTRKKLKEGIDMTREFGEKSYNPAQFSCDFWGGNNSYWQLFRRKLPQNIVLASYEKPLTLSELSVELGVSAPYLEDELDILTEHWLIQKSGDKYQTNMVIFKNEAVKRAEKDFPTIYRPYAGRIAKLISDIKTQFGKLEFEGNDVDDNRMKWIMTNLAMYFGVIEAHKESVKTYGEYPPLSNGTNGFVFGYDFDHQAEGRFNGIYAEIPSYKNDLFVSIFNYRIIERCQNVNLGGGPCYLNRITALHDAIIHKHASEKNEQIIPMIKEGYISSENGILSANFPVFTGKLFENEVKKLLTPAIDEIAHCMDEISGLAIDRIRPSIPNALKDRCDYVIRISYMLDTIAYLVETMVEEGALTVPNEKANLCMFGVDRRE